VKRPDEERPGGHADERRRQFEASRGLEEPEELDLDDDEEEPEPLPDEERDE
jgi:hypothetical protein